MAYGDLAWKTSRWYMAPAAIFAARGRGYGLDRIPLEGGCVLAINHLEWIDVPLVGGLSPRNINYVAKVEAHETPFLGWLIRQHGTLAVRRGESDRDAVRLMRQAARDGRAVGLFIEGTRQRSGVPGRAAAGRGDGGDPGARAGRADRRLRHAVLEARQLRAVLDRGRRAVPARGLPAGQGYKRLQEIMAHRVRLARRSMRRAAAGSVDRRRPRQSTSAAGPVWCLTVLTPQLTTADAPLRGSSDTGPRTSARRASTPPPDDDSARHGRDRRLPQRRQVDARQPAERDARGGRPRHAGDDARPQGARLRVGRQALPRHRHGRRRRRVEGSDRALDRGAGAARGRRGRPRALPRRRARRRHDGRRGARADRPPLAQAGDRAREQDRRPVAGDARARVPPPRPRRPVPAVRHARPQHGRPARRGRRAARGHGRGAAAPARRRRHPRRDPRPAERRQVVALQRARRRGAHDRLRGPRHDARRDRHA